MSMGTTSAPWPRYTDLPWRPPALMPPARLIVRVALLCPVLCAAPVAAASAARASAACGFTQGFAALHDLIPDVVGACVTDAVPQAGGDVQQPTANGMLVWRKAD